VNRYSIYKAGGLPILCDVGRRDRDEGRRGNEKGTERCDSSPFGAFDNMIRAESVASVDGEMGAVATGPY
jgi:hypothetical protein